MSPLEYFDHYTQLSWEVIPLLPDSKIPFIKGWNGYHNPVACRKHFIKHPEYNLGLRLGRIVDVEADTKQGNELLAELTKDHIHPTYKSSKSIHHLFRCNDRKLTRVVLYGIEFRGNKHQSVLPPSQVNGVEYRWIDTASFMVPKMPSSLAKFYDRHVRQQHSSRWLEPWCTSCGKQHRPIHHKRYQLELLAFAEMGMRWLCHECRTIDVRPMCRKIRRSKLTTL